LNLIDILAGGYLTTVIAAGLDVYIPLFLLIVQTIPQRNSIKVSNAIRESVVVNR
jgi:hypothetical protein